MTATTAPQFRPGVRLIEASAGTGKTFRIGQYLLSLVLSTPDLSMASVVVVTFTRAATAELQGRIRDVLRGALLAVQVEEAGAAGDPADPSIAVLLAAIGLGVSARPSIDALRSLCGERWPGLPAARQRLENAVRDYDQMVVATIHGLCQRILSQNALHTGSPVRFDLREQLSTDLRQAANDVVARWERQTNPRWRVWGLDGVVSEMLKEDAFPESWFKAGSVSFGESLIGTPVASLLQELDQHNATAVRALRDGIPALLATVQQAPKAPKGAGNGPHKLFGVVDAGGARADRDATLALAAWLDSERPRCLQHWFARVKGDGATPLVTLAEGLDGFDAASIPASVAPSFFTRALLDTHADALGVRHQHLVATGIPDAVQAVADAHIRLLLAARAQLVTQVRSLVDERLAADDAISHNQTISAVATALRGPAGARLVATLRGRFRYAFVDEFQDTDPEQWALFEHVFVRDADAATALYAVGDPKQAIYSFRGADVATYVEAADAIAAIAGAREPLGSNWRSAPQHVEAINILFHHSLGSSLDTTATQAVSLPPGLTPTAFDGTALAPVPVLQSPADGGVVRGIRHDRIAPALLVSAPALGGTARVEPGVDVCVFGPGGVMLPPGTNRTPDPDAGLDDEARAPERGGIATRVAIEIAELLASGALLPRVGTQPANAPAPTPISPSDIAVLGPSNQSVVDVYGELLRLGVPATLMRESVISDSVACGWLLAMLAVVGHPDGTSERIALADAAPWDVGAGGLAALRDPTGDAAARFSRWAGDLAKRASRDGYLRVLRGMLDDERWHQRVFGDQRGAPSPAANVLARPAGERELADLLQLIEVVDRWVRIDRASLGEIRRRLATTRSPRSDRRASGSSRTLGRSRGEDPTLEARLESESQGVRLLTMHKAKGLEFPVVFVLPVVSELRPPSLLEQRAPGTLRRLPDVWRKALTGKLEALDGFDLCADRAWLVAARERAMRAAIDEQTRLLYVALTRARITTRWYVASPTPSKRQHTEPKGATARLLGWWVEPARLAAIAGSGAPDPLGWPAGSLAGPKDAPCTLRGVLERTGGVLAARADALARATGTPLVPGALVRVHYMQPRPLDDAERLRPAVARALQDLATASDPGALHVRPWRRPRLSQRWKAWSFTSIHAFAKPAGEGAPDDDLSDRDVLLDKASEPLPTLGPPVDTAEHGGSDEPATPPILDDADAQADRGTPPDGDASDLLLATFPSGKRPGTCLHHILEHYDFRLADEPDAEGTLRAVVDAGLRRHGLDSGRWSGSATQGLLAAVRSPLGGPLGDARLADIPSTRRLNELRFSLPIRGGVTNRDGDAVWCDALTEALLDREVGGTVPQAWVDTVRAARFGALGLAGFLTGSIDLAFQSDRDGRWYVADYKSNRVSTDWSRPLQASDFGMDALQRVMVQDRYLLQLTLYLVALHRYLRSRVRDYSFETHVGGAYYLFLRGMSRSASGSDALPTGAGPGVFFDRPRARHIERLSALFDSVGEGGQGGAA